MVDSQVKLLSIVPELRYDGSIRICNDQKITIHKCFPEIYPVPKIEDIYVNLREGKYLSKLDLVYAYQQLEPHVRSKT